MLFAAAGHGQVAAIIGEAGVGKSCLLYEFTHSHNLLGMASDYRQARAIRLPQGRGRVGPATLFWRNAVEGAPEIRRRSFAGHARACIVGRAIDVRFTFGDG
jgi:hypothetical protein